MNNMIYVAFYSFIGGMIFQWVCDKYEKRLEKKNKNNPKT